MKNIGYLILIFSAISFLSGCDDRTTVVKEEIPWTPTTPAARIYSLDNFMQGLPAPYKMEGKTTHTGSKGKQLYLTDGTINIVRKPDIQQGGITTTPRKVTYNLTINKTTGPFVIGNTTTQYFDENRYLTGIDLLINNSVNQRTCITMSSGSALPATIQDNDSGDLGALFCIDSSGAIRSTLKLKWSAKEDNARNIVFLLNTTSRQLDSKRKHESQEIEKYTIDPKGNILALEYGWDAGNYHMVINSTI